MTEVTTAPPRGGLALGHRTQANLLSIAGVVSIFLVWWIGAGATRFIPPLTEVLAELPEFLGDSATWTAVGATTQRVLISLALAVAFGVCAAAIMTRSVFWGRVVSVYVSTGMAIPSTITALVALFIFQKDPAGATFVVAVTTAPFIALMLHEGLKHLDHGLAETAEVYRLSAVDRLRHVVVPQILPYFLSAIRNEYAHAWKIVVVAELFLVSSGMGWQFAQAFDRFHLITVMLWLIVFVAILLVSEYGVIRPLERRVSRWREQK